MSALSEVVCRSAAVDSACRPGPETLSPCSSPGADARCSRAAFVAIPTHAASVAVRSSSIARCPVKVVHATPVRRPLLTLEGPVRSKTGLPVSMTFAGDDADEVKMDYSRADEDGSRIFLSGLAQSVDEKRLLLALQSFKGLVEVKLAKPGLGFALFQDPASASVALEGIGGVKIGGQALNARRARSFYIQQQQQATMFSSINLRLREQGVVEPSRFDLRRRIDFESPRPPVPAMPVAPPGMQRKPLSRNTAKSMYAYDDLDDSSSEDDTIFEEEARIRKQVQGQESGAGDREGRGRVCRRRERGCFACWRARRLEPLARMLVD